MANDSTRDDVLSHVRFEIDRFRQCEGSTIPLKQRLVDQAGCRLLKNAQLCRAAGLEQVEWPETLLGEFEEWNNDALLQVKHSARYTGVQGVVLNVIAELIERDGLHEDIRELSLHLMMMRTYSVAQQLADLLDREKEDFLATVEQEAEAMAETSLGRAILGALAKDYRQQARRKLSGWRRPFALNAIEKKIKSNLEKP